MTWKMPKRHEETFAWIDKYGNPHEKRVRFLSRGDKAFSYLGDDGLVYISTSRCNEDIDKKLINLFGKENQVVHLPQIEFLGSALGEGCNTTDFYRMPRYTVPIDSHGRWSGVYQAFQSIDRKLRERWKNRRNDKTLLAYDYELAHKTAKRIRDPYARGQFEDAFRELHKFHHFVSRYYSTQNAKIGWDLHPGNLGTTTDNQTLILLDPIRVYFS